ncbi:hypothetical protein [Shewanella litorisediminis]|uniref:Uncharacterized protein n=1 Tax=Shewanella litorisediminis TaxID=1173586 RepID=A0ABX7G1A7_9GAMM|nr:hypothetical protein [Shewanella litorisediminis]MCL2919032.1 hypothetical protein [Shewanella litorisediminis]QRH01096.1 hypothetical protein JQC75_14690 [Shewanella litorisediminis]
MKCLQLMFLTILVTFIFNTQAQAGLTETMACDDCDYQNARAKALLFAPLQPCSQGLPGEQLFTQPLTDGSGSLENTACSLSKNVIFANVATGQSHKFIVTATTSGFDETQITVKDTYITTAEQGALERLFDFYDEYKQIDGHFTLIATQHSELQRVLASSPQYSSEDNNCDNHPIKYLQPKGQDEIHQAIKRDIFDRMGSQSWNDISQNTQWSGWTLNIAHPGGGASVHWNLVTNKVEAAYKFGDDNNMLWFEVLPYGEIDTENNKNLSLTFKIDDQISRVDGQKYAYIVNSVIYDTTHPNMGTFSDCAQRKLADMASEVETEKLSNDTDDYWDAHDQLGLETDYSTTYELCKTSIQAYTCHNENCKLQTVTWYEKCRFGF